MRDSANMLIHISEIFCNLKFALLIGKQLLFAVIVMVQPTCPWSPALVVVKLMIARTEDTLGGS